MPVKPSVARDVSAATRDDFCEPPAAAQRDDQYAITLDDGQTYQVGSVENFYGPLQSS